MEVNPRICHSQSRSGPCTPTLTPYPLGRPARPWRSQLTSPGHAAPVGVHKPPWPEQDQLGIPQRGQGEVGGTVPVARPTLRHTQPPRQLPQHRHAYAVSRARQSGIPQASHLRAAPGKLRPNNSRHPRPHSVPWAPKQRSGNAEQRCSGEGARRKGPETRPPRTPEGWAGRAP